MSGLMASIQYGAMRSATTLKVQVTAPRSLALGYAIGFQRPLPLQICRSRATPRARHVGNFAEISGPVHLRRMCIGETTDQREVCLQAGLRGLPAVSRRAGRTSQAVDIPHHASRSANKKAPALPGPQTRWRRERDSNPRYRRTCTPDFESGAFDHSAISPCRSPRF